MHEPARRPDRFLLYEAAVQDAGAELEFIERVYDGSRGRRCRFLREDFCGTAVLAGSWVSSAPDRRAWGVDANRVALDWALRHRVTTLGKALPRLELIHADVRSLLRPRVDVATALGFSCGLFRERSSLLEYFRVVRRSLRRAGILVLDTFGGTESMTALVERRRVGATVGPDGRRVPAFTYVWEQASFNPVDHHLTCYIHFELARTRLRRAFAFETRLWTLPELRELLDEAGFDASEVYVEGWNRRANEPDGVWRLARRFENQEGWTAYVVARR